MIINYTVLYTIQIINIFSVCTSYFHWLFIMRCLHYSNLQTRKPDSRHRTWHMVTNDEQADFPDILYVVKDDSLLVWFTHIGLDVYYKIKWTRTFEVSVWLTNKLLRGCKCCYFLLFNGGLRSICVAMCGHYVKLHVMHQKWDYRCYDEWYGG